jgi:RecA-family ATPase
MAEEKKRKMGEIQREPVKWLWEPYIPSGKITLIQGDGSTGKTTVSLAIAAAVSTGISLPGSIGCGVPASVLVQNAEDGLGDTIRPRLEQFGGDCDMIYNIDDEEYALSFTDERIEQSIIETKARLCILDPLQAYFRGANMNSANSVRPVMKHLSNIAGRNDCAILLVGHLHKSGGNSQRNRCFPCASIPLNQSDFSTRNIWFPQPFHGFTPYFTHFSDFYFCH